MLLHSLFGACRVGRRLLITMAVDADIDVAVDTRTVEVVSLMVVLDEDYATPLPPLWGAVDDSSLATRHIEVYHHGFQHGLVFVPCWELLWFLFNSVDGLGFKTWTITSMNTT